MTFFKLNFNKYIISNLLNVKIVQIQKKTNKQTNI
jgi:hypothetical protein